jgi:hypothetical protein
MEARSQSPAVRVCIKPWRPDTTHRPGSMGTVAWFRQRFRAQSTASHTFTSWRGTFEWRYTSPSSQRCEPSGAGFSGPFLVHVVRLNFHHELVPHENRVSAICVSPMMSEGEWDLVIGSRATKTFATAPFDGLGIGSSLEEIFLP